MNSSTDDLNTTLEGAALELAGVATVLKRIEEIILSTAHFLEPSQQQAADFQNFDRAEQTIQQIAALLHALSCEKTRESAEGISVAIDALNLGQLAQNLRHRSDDPSAMATSSATVDLF